MSQSIEARLPFLDYHIVEFAFSLSHRFKIENGVTKRVLREAMKDYLPDPIISSFRKVPFSSPDSAWVRGPLRLRIESTFLKGDPKIYECLEPAATRALFAEFQRFHALPHPSVSHLEVRQGGTVDAVFFPMMSTKVLPQQPPTRTT